MTQPGYSPAPAKPATPTRLITPDGSILSGDIPLSGGNLVNVQKAGANGVAVLGASPKRPRSVELFVPGALVAKTLLVVTGLAAPVLSGLDAHFLTAPGAGTDGANFAKVNVTDGTTSTDFPLGTNGVADYHMGLDPLSQVAGSCLGDGVRHVAMSGYKARSTPFRVTTPLTIGGVGLQSGWTVGSSAGGGEPQPWRAGIAADFLKTDGKTIATIPWLTDSLGLPTYYDLAEGEIQLFPAFAVHPFAGTIALVPGTTYSLVSASVGVPGHQRPFNAGGGPVLSNLTVGQHNDVNGNNWNFGPAPVGDNSYPLNNDPGDGPFNPGNIFKLYGAVLGKALFGPVTISITITGAPPNPGSDLYLSVQL